MTLLEKQAPAEVGQPKATARRSLVWGAVAIVVSGLMVSALVWAGDGADNARPFEEPIQVTESRGAALERLVSLGYIPEEALETGDLYTPQERLIMAAVYSGIIPQQQLERENFVLKDLLDSCLTPRQAVSEAS